MIEKKDITMIKKFIILLPLMLAACATTKNVPTTAASVDLNRYMGTWYEIASFPNRFQKNCKCTTANYRLESNKVSIVNMCIKSNTDKVSTAKGNAWVVPNTNNTQLKVQFFWPFKGDYWILYVNPNYTHVLVGSPNREYLWILAREREINHSSYHKLIKIAKEKGYDITKLNKTDQNCHVMIEHNDEL